MLLIDCKDDGHEELQNRAKQIKYSPKDMKKASNAGACWSLPRTADVQELYDRFCNQYGEKVENLAKERGWQIDRNTFLGPQIILLKDSGTLIVGKDLVLFSIVIPNPSEHKFADEGEHGYRGLMGKTSPASQAEVSSTNTSPLPPASINIISDSSPPRTLTGLEIGDVIISEPGETLLVDGKRNSSNAQSIGLVSAAHITSSRTAGEGGWKEDAVKEEEGNEHAI